MRVIILSIEFPPGPGGVGTLAYQAARYLSERGWQVEVMTPQDHVERTEIERFNAQIRRAARPFDIHTLSRVEPPALEGLQRLALALRAVQKRRPDVLLAVGMQAVWLGALLSRISRVPLVAVGVGSEFGGGRARLAKALNRWAFGRARKVIAISEHTRDLIVGAGIDAGQVVVVPCGADAGRYRPGLETGELRARLGIGSRTLRPGRRVLLTVGQLSERKAQDVVIRALPQILRVCPDVTYILAGLATRRAEMERLAADLGVQEHVIVTGIVPEDELAVYYNLADVFVLVSRRTDRGEVEGYGIVVAEAALCGVPSVLSAACGVAESIAANGAALVVEPDDPPATARAILQLLTDDALRAQMGRAARRFALETGTWAQQMSRYDEILRSV